MADAAQKNPFPITPTPRRPRRTPRSPSVSYRPRPRSAAVPPPRAAASRIPVGARGFGPITIGDQLFRALAFEFIDRELQRALLGPAKPDSGGRRKPVRARARQPEPRPVSNPLVNPVPRPVAQPAREPGQRTVLVSKPETAPQAKPAAAPKSAPGAAKNPVKLGRVSKPVGGRVPLPRFQIPNFFSRISAPPLSPTTVRLTAIKQPGVKFGQLELPASNPLAKPGLQLQAERCGCQDTRRKSGVYFVKQPATGPESSIFWREVNASNAGRSVGGRRRVKLKSVQR